MNNIWKLRDEESVLENEKGENFAWKNLKILEEALKNCSDMVIPFIQHCSTPARIYLILSQLNSFKLLRMGIEKSFISW